jgi:hypothetical protein
LAAHGCAAELFEPWMVSSRRQSGFVTFSKKKVRPVAVREQSIRSVDVGLKKRNINRDLLESI